MAENQSTNDIDAATGCADDQSDLGKAVAELLEVRKTCDHSSYRGFAKDGRCCPRCGTFMVDFGD